MPSHQPPQPLHAACIDIKVVIHIDVEGTEGTHRLFRVNMTVSRNVALLLANAVSALPLLMFTVCNGLLSHREHRGHIQGSLQRT